MSKRNTAITAQRAHTFSLLRLSASHSSTRAHAYILSTLIPPSLSLRLSLLLSLFFSCPIRGSVRDPPLHISFSHASGRRFHYLQALSSLSLSLHLHLFYLLPLFHSHSHCLIYPSQSLCDVQVTEKPACFGRSMTPKHTMTAVSAHSPVPQSPLAHEQHQARSDSRCEETLR